MSEPSPHPDAPVTPLADLVAARREKLRRYREGAGHRALRRAASTGSRRSSSAGEVAPRIKRTEAARRRRRRPATRGHVDRRARLAVSSTAAVSTTTDRAHRPRGQPRRPASRSLAKARLPLAARPPATSGQRLEVGRATAAFRGKNLLRRHRGRRGTSRATARGGLRLGLSRRGSTASPLVRHRKWHGLTDPARYRHPLRRHVHQPGDDPHHCLPQPWSPSCARWMDGRGFLEVGRADDATDRRRRATRPFVTHQRPRHRPLPASRRVST